MTYKKQRKEFQKSLSHGKLLKKNSVSKKKKYSIEIKPSAQKELSKLPKKEQKRISNKIDRLETNPFPDGVVKLRGNDDFFRLRVGSYRIIYKIEEDRLVILILKIGNRKSIYKKI